MTDTTTAHPATFGGQSFYLNSPVIDFGPERDSLPGNLPPVVRLTGGFAEDLPTGGFDHTEPTRPAPQRQTRDEINPNRTFFVTRGHDEGGFRQSWNRWRIVRDSDGVPYAVDVIYAEQRDVHDKLISTDKITLEGADAFNFLKLVGDRNREAFDRPRNSGYRA